MSIDGVVRVFIIFLSGCVVPSNEELCRIIRHLGSGIVSDSAGSWSSVSDGNNGRRRIAGFHD